MRSRVQLIPRKKHQFEWRYLFGLVSFAAFFVWMQISGMFGRGMWSDWVFAEGGQSDAIGTIWHNITTLSVFNEYFRENLLHLFVLNYQWVFTALAIVGIILAIKNVKKSSSAHDTQLYLTVAVMGTFFLLYCLLVLSFQTYPIPRYTLPIEPYLLFASAYTLIRWGRSVALRGGIIVFIACMIIVRLVSSIDPVSIALWGIQSIEGQRVYAANDHLSGNDGLTYNGQFLIIVANRTKDIRRAYADGLPITSPDCRFIYADIRNDRIVLPALGYKEVPACQMVANN